MNAYSSIATSSQNKRRQTALDAWYQMRGKMVEAFALIEMAITETLQHLSQKDVCSGEIVINPILNQRVAQLSEVLAPSGALRTEGKKLTAPLKAISDQIPFRNFLCHGHSSLYLDENGRWIVQLKMPAVSKGQAQIGEILLTQDCAEQKLNDLHRDAARLGNQLKQLRERTGFQCSPNPSAPEAQASR
jgi:hypothetical protein